MKKRLFAFLMAGTMVLSAGTTVFAEAEIPEITWDQFEGQIEEDETLAGDFVTFGDIAIQMYVPFSFEEVELTDEDLEDGYVGYFTLGEDAAVGVQYVDMDGMELPEYAELLTEEYGVEDAELMLVNGIGVLSYTSPDDESVCIAAIATQMGYIMEFSFTPIDDEEFKSIAQFMVASIQNVIPEEADE